MLNSQEIHEFRKELLSRDNSRLSELYSRLKPECIRILKSKEICPKYKLEDLYTDAILVLRKNILTGKVTELTNPVSYMVSICRNIARYEHRKQMGRIKKEEQVIAHLYQGENTTIDNDEMKHELVQTCKKSLVTLSERCQQILIAYYVHELKMKEIAPELGLSSSDVVKTLKSRCYKTWIKNFKSLVK